MGITRLAQAVVLLGAIWLTGCQSLPSGSTGEAPPAPPPEAATPTPMEKLAPPKPAVAPERALVTHISRTYSVGNQHATRVVRAASDASRRTGLPRTLILAVIAVESSFNSMAVSSMGARGLMQVLPEAHPEKVERIGGEENLHDVETGIQIGARILREYYRMTGNLRAALRRYSGAARHYADKVLARKHQFDLVEGNGSAPRHLSSIWSEEVASHVDTESAEDAVFDDESIGALQYFSSPPS